VNQLRDWEGKCQRCCEPTDMHTMSMFDVTLICMVCCEVEQRHPRYNQAREAEAQAVTQGNTNFPGIGYPDPDAVDG